MESEKKIEDLFDDYVALCQKYKETFRPKEFGELMIMYSAKMMLDCAPEPLEGMIAINGAIEGAIMLYQGENQE